MEIIYNQFDRSRLLSAMMDCLGYSEDDFNGYSKADLWGYLEPTERQEIAEYMDLY